MITNWKCACGSENSITNRFCPSCSSEIPSEWTSKISTETIKWAKEVIAQENYERNSKAAYYRHSTLSRYFKPIIILSLLVSIIISTLTYQSNNGLIITRYSISTLADAILHSNRLYNINDNFMFSL